MKQRRRLRERLEEALAAGVDQRASEALPPGMYQCCFCPRVTNNVYRSRFAGLEIISCADCHERGVARETREGSVEPRPIARF